MLKFIQNHLLHTYLFQIRNFRPQKSSRFHFPGKNLSTTNSKYHEKFLETQISKFISYISIVKTTHNHGSPKILVLKK